MFTHTIISACGAFPATPSFSLADSAQEQADPDFPLTFFAFMTLGYEFSFRGAPRVSLFGVLRPAENQTQDPRIYFVMSGRGPAVSSLGTRAMPLNPRKPQDHHAGWASPKGKLLLRLGPVQQPNSSHLKIWCDRTPQCLG